MYRAQPTCFGETKLQSRSRIYRKNNPFLMQFCNVCMNSKTNQRFDLTISRYMKWGIIGHVVEKYMLKHTRDYTLSIKINILI